MISRLRQAMRHRIEWWSAVGAILWSKALFWPGGTLDGNPSYTLATRIMSTGDWELAAFVVGVLQLALLISGRRWARLWGSAIAAWFWLCLGVAFYTARSGSPGYVPLLVLGAQNLHCLLACRGRAPPPAS